MIRSPMVIDYVCYNNKLRPVKNTCAVDSGDGAVIHTDLLCIRLNTVEDLDSQQCATLCCLRVHPHCKIQTISKTQVDSYGKNSTSYWAPTTKIMDKWRSSSRNGTLSKTTNVRNEPNTERHRWHRWWSTSMWYSPVLETKMTAETMFLPYIPRHRA